MAERHKAIPAETRTGTPAGIRADERREDRGRIGNRTAGRNGSKATVCVGNRTADRRRLSARIAAHARWCGRCPLSFLLFPARLCRKDAETGTAVLDDFSSIVVKIAGF